MIQHNIRNLCKSKGISMAEVARESGVPYNTLKKWGIRPKHPSAVSVMKVSRVLGVPAEELMKEEEV